MSNEKEGERPNGRKLKGSSGRETALGKSDPNSELKGAKRWEPLRGRMVPRKEKQKEYWENLWKKKPARERTKAKETVLKTNTGE